MPNREEQSTRHREENRALRLVRKQIKRHRKLARPRRKDWLSSAADPEALYDLDSPSSERVVPPVERVRLRAAAPTAPAELDEEEGAASVAATTAERGIVVEVSSSLCRVDVAGQTLVCMLRGILSAAESGLTNVVAVGDRVRVSRSGDGQGVVEEVLPRHGVLMRPDVFLGHLQQVVVANLGQVLVVASWREPPPWLEMIDRYLIAAERSGLRPAICINKIDLAGDVGVCLAEMRPYLDLGYCVLFTSAVTGQGVDELRKLLHNRMTALAGLSGVGKSSLLAAVQPGLQLRIAEVSEHWHQGRHTTSQVRLLHLEAGGYVVDTPGVREFGLSGLRRAELVRYYPDIAALAAGCRFANCTHTGEPGCAVQSAAAQGRLAAWRHKNYTAIYRSLPGR